MTLPTVIVGGIILLAVVIIIRKIIRDKKNHVCSCSGGCSGCSHKCKG
ncbi:MAG: FeoB-associated Cys-rich membrane protein [Lachnospiraceae bacterium]|nr:FeoB-associated Cys-rich membrane protein [Lachnospiraceae bacterium]